MHQNKDKKYQKMVLGNNKYNRHLDGKTRVIKNGEYQNKILWVISSHIKRLTSTIKIFHEICKENLQFSQKMS